MNTNSNINISLSEKINSQEIYNKSILSSYYGSKMTVNDVEEKMKDLFEMSDSQCNLVISRIKNNIENNRNITSGDNLLMFSVTSSQLFMILDSLGINHLIDRLVFFNNYFSAYTDFSYDDAKRLITEITTPYASCGVFHSEVTNFITSLMKKTKISPSEVSKFIFNEIVPLTLEKVTFLNSEEFSLFEDEKDIYECRKVAINEILDTSNRVMYYSDSQFEIPEKFILDNLDYLSPGFYIKLYGFLSDDGKKKIKDYVITLLEDYTSNIFNMSPEQIQMMNIHIDLDLDSYSLFSEVTDSEPKYDLQPLKAYVNKNNMISALKSSLNTAYGLPKNNITGNGI